MDDIYEYFSQYMGCYVSDLRMSRHWKVDRGFILGIPESRFTLTQWNDFVSYACSKQVSFSSIEEAKSYLAAKKKRKP